MRCKRIERLTLWGAWTIENMVVEMRMACERMRARLSNWTCEPMNLWILESISQCINEAVTHWTNKRVNQWINLINEEKMNGWVNQWIMKSLNLESGNLFLHGNGQARFKDNSPHDKDKQFFSASIMNRFFSKPFTTRQCFWAVWECSLPDSSVVWHTILVYAKKICHISNMKKIIPWDFPI